MITIKDFLNTPNGTIQLNWSSIEKNLGFQIHNGLKDFYSRLLCGEHSCIEGKYNLNESQLIGSFYTDVGDFLLLFNNDTGSIEWNDSGYGHFEVYEDNPYGIFAKDIYEFYDKLSTGMF